MVSINLNRDPSKRVTSASHGVTRVFVKGDRPRRWALPVSLVVPICFLAYSVWFWKFKPESILPNPPAKPAAAAKKADNVVQHSVSASSFIPSSVSDLPRALARDSQDNVIVRNFPFDLDPFSIRAQNGDLKNLSVYYCDRKYDFWIGKGFSYSGYTVTSVTENKIIFESKDKNVVSIGYVL